MAIIGINSVQRREKKDVLDKISQGLNIANSLLGVSLAVPEYLQKRDANKLNAAESQVNIAQKTDTAQEGEQDSLFVPGLGFRKPKEVVDYDQQIKAAKVMDLQPLNTNPELFKQVQRDAPDIAGISGVTIGDARDAILKRSTTDPRLELALKSFDLQLKNYAAGQQKQEKQDLKGRFDDLRTRINKIKDPEVESLGQIKLVEDQIQSGSTIAYSTAAAIIAKKVGKDTGALTESDIGRYLPKTLQSKAGDVFNYITGRSTATLSPEVKAALNTAVGSAAKSIRRDLAVRIQDEIDQYTAGDPEFATRDEVKNYFMSLGRQIKGLDKATLIRRLEEKKDMNPDRQPEIDAKIKQIEDAF